MTPVSCDFSESFPFLYRREKIACLVLRPRAEKWVFDNNPCARVDETRPT